MDFVRELMGRVKGLKAFLLNREVEEERKVDKEGGARDSRWCGWTVGIGSVVFVCLLLSKKEISKSLSLCFLLLVYV
jgi:hypothetical protein